MHICHDYNSRAVRHEVTKQRAKNEGRRAKPKRNAAAGTYWAGTVAPLFIGFTGFGPPQRQRRQALRALEGPRLANRGCCQVETEKTLLFTISPRRLSRSSGAYVCLYCWPVVAFSGRIILPLKQWVPYTECSSREVNDCLLRIMRASGSTVARDEGIHGHRSRNVISWKWESAHNFVYHGY